MAGKDWGAIRKFPADQLSDALADVWLAVEVRESKCGAGFVYIWF